MANDWITTRQAITLSGYHGDHIRRLIRTGEIKGKKFAIVWMVSRSSLLSYKKRQEQQGEKRGRKPLT